MFRFWSLLIALASTALQNCAGETSCVLWSSAGPVVRLGSSFRVFCTFKCDCGGSMYKHPSTPLGEKLNSTTICLEVKNITEKGTYSCRCDQNRPQPPHCHPSDLSDPCGMDISAGYPPDRPRNVSCIYGILTDESGAVTCTWDRGRDTHLRDKFVLWLRTSPGNHTEGLTRYNVSSGGRQAPSWTFSLSRSVPNISVWVEAQNALGSVQSSMVNYTIRDIMRPSTPVLEQPRCSSRQCVIRVQPPVEIQHLQIQFRADQQQEWTTHPDSVEVRNSPQAQSVSSLEPCRLYHFRARSKFSSGLWSPWSANISSWTQEEAPTHALDVWFTPAPDFKSMKIYWKEAKTSVCAVQYEVKVQCPDWSVTNVSDRTSYSVDFYGDCEVTVRARNSKGSSPPAVTTTRLTQAKPLQDVRATAANSIVAISWKKPETAPSEYVVEWYPEGPMLEELRWLRLDTNSTFTALTDVKPWECYEGAVFAFYNESSVSRTRFQRVAASESAPEMGPSATEEVKGNDVIVTWTELPRHQRRGCIRNYTIYLKNHYSNRTWQMFSSASERTFVIRDLSSALYSLWISASTAKGEGPAGQKIKFYIEEDTQLHPLLMCVLAALMVLFPFCLWKSSAAKRRFRRLFQCVIPDVVPDPANSKWAKECAKEKGKMNLLFPADNSSLSQKEDETVLVDVEELLKQTCDTYTPTNISSRLLPPTRPSPESELLYPAIAYIKSFSHDSDSSDHTQGSLDTNTTVDYISSQGLENLDNYDEEEEEEQIQFLSSFSDFTEPLEFGGKLTLDAVKIDCSDFFQNVYCDSEI